MKRIAILGLALLAVLPGCKDGGFWSRTPPEPVIQKTKDEYLAMFRPLLEPLRQGVTAPAVPNVPLITDDARDQVIKALTDAKTQYGQDEIAQEAFREVGYEAAELAKRARDAERWRVALACVDAFEVLGLQSHALDRLNTYGRLVMGRPKVAVRGFMEDKEIGVTSVFIELTDRETGKTTRVVKRVGEEFNNLRLVEILKGSNTVRFEYLPIEGMFFDVEGPRR